MKNDIRFILERYHAGGATAMSVLNADARSALPDMWTWRRVSMWLMTVVYATIRHPAAIIIHHANTSMTIRNLTAGKITRRNT